MDTIRIFYRGGKQETIPGVERVEVTRHAEHGTRLRLHMANGKIKKRPLEADHPIRAWFKAVAERIQ